MKFLTRFTPLKNWGSTRVVFLDKANESSEAGQGIEKLLRNPLSFSFASVAELEKLVGEQDGHLDAKQQHQFSKLVNYHLARMQNEGNSEVRSRTLLAIFRRPGLSQFLTGQQRRAVEQLLTSERKDLEKLGSSEKKPDEWTPEQAIRLARSYRFVRNRLNTANLKIDEGVRNAGDKLKVYAQVLLSKPKAEYAPLDKLFLIELKQIFPRSSDWGNPELYQGVHEQAKELESGFKKSFAESGSVPSEYKDYWDVLTPGSDDPSVDAKFQDFLTKSAQAESLQALAGKDKDSKGPLVLSFDEYNFLTQFKSTEEGQGVDFSHGDQDAKIATANKAKEEKAAALEKLKADKKAENDRLQTLSSEALAQELPAGSELASLYQDQKDTWGEWVVKPDTPKKEGEEDAEESNDEDAHYAAHKQWRADAAAAILKENKTFSEEAEKEAQQAATEATNAWQQELDKRDQLTDDLELLKDPKKKADELLESHKKHFERRLNAGRLVAADLDLITHLDETQQEAFLGSNFKQVRALLDRTRSAIGDALSDEFKLSTLSDLEASDLDSVDKFLSYEAVIGRLAADKTDGRTSALLEAYEAFDKNSPVDVRQVIGSVVLDFREQILEGINSAQTRESVAYQRFLDNYSRQHQAIHRSSRVQQLLDHSENIANKRGTIDAEYEHAHETVSSLFAEAEEAALLEGLNKILKTEVSASSVLNDIQGRLPENDFIHSASKGEIDNYKRHIVQTLSGNVTPENDDPAHLNAIADDLLAKLDQQAASRTAKAALQAEVKNLEHSDEDNLANSDRLELAKRTKIIHLEVSDINEDFQLHLEQVQTALEKGEDPKLLGSQFLRRYAEGWQPRLKALSTALAAECDLYFGKRNKFTTDLLYAINSKLEVLDTGVQHFKQGLGSGALSADDVGFKSLMVAINNDILPLFDLESGTVAKKEEHKVDATLKDAAHTHKYVRDSLGLLKPGGAETARRNYDDKLRQYEDTINMFKTSWLASKKRLERDLGRLSDELFAAKHKITKGQAQKILRTNNERLEDAQWMLDYFSGGEPTGSENPFKGSKSGVFDRWLSHYEDPELQPEALRFMKAFKDFEANLGEGKEDFAGEVKGLQKWMNDYDNNKPTFWWGNKRYSIAFKTYSITSVFMMVKQFFEHWQKMTDRQNDRMAAELGTDIFGLETAFGREFNREANKKEDERVSDFKDVHKNSDYQTLFQIIRRAKNARKHKDEVNAAVQLLMEKGELSWDSADFLMMLGRLQDGVSFSIPADLEAYAKNPAELRQKIGQAVTTIWDRPTWMQWKADLPSKYDSQLKSHEKDYQEEVQRGAVDEYLQGMLEKWSAGEQDPNLEKAKFESYIYQAFDRGEMNGYPIGNDRRWFYLIKGLTLRNPSGETILSPDVLSRFGTLQGKMPFMDAFDSKEWKKDGKVVPEGTPGAHDGSWNYQDIQAWATYFDGISIADADTPTAGKAVRKWLNESLLTTNDAQDRMGKVNLTDMDRDDAGVLPLLISSERLRDGILRYSSGDKRPADDKYYVNLIGSFKNNFEDSVEYMRTVLKDNKDASGYEDRKKIQLRRFGEMMRTYFMISQVLAGNWDTEGSVGAVALSNAEWTNNHAGKTYNNINKTIRTFTGNSALESAYDERYGEQKSTNAGKYDTKNAKHKRLMELVRDTFNDKIFEDTDRLESFLESSDIDALVREMRN